jgi:hypothetical protein
MIGDSKLTDQPRHSNVDKSTHCSLRSPQWLNLIEGFNESVPLDLHVIAPLEVEPEPLGGPEIAGHSKSSVGGDAPLAMHDFVDAPWWDPNGQGQSVLGYTQRLEVLTQKNFTWMDRIHDQSGVQIQSLPW